MLKLIFLIIFVTLTISTKSNEKDSDTILNVNFEDSKIGIYDKKAALKDWKTFSWSDLGGRSQIVELDKSKVLKIEYPKGQIGSRDSGSQFVVPFKSHKELWLSYSLKFSNDFDFRLGGKLPGLTNNGSKFTGGRNSEIGWSARMMWKSKGKVIAYLYHKNMKGKWGDQLFLQGCSFQRGKWHSIKQHIKINDESSQFGILEVYFDGTKALSYDIDFGSKNLIDSFYFSTFYGGSTEDWAPQSTGYIFFDNFKISVKN